MFKIIAKQKEGKYISYTGFFWALLLGMCFFLIFSINNFIPQAKAATVGITCSGQNIAQGVDFASGDDLTLTGAGTCTLTTAATLASLTVGNDSDATILTHTGNTSSQTNILDITTTGNINITASASISVDAKGYTQDQGPGKGISQSGAGHGGAGGDGNTLDPAIANAKKGI